MKSLQKPWSDEDCGGVRGAGGDTWHKSRAQAVGLPPDAVTAIAAVAHLCVEDIVMRFKDFVVSLSSPLSEGHCVRMPSPFSTGTIRGHFTELPFYLRALHSLFLPFLFSPSFRNRKIGE